MGLSADVQSYYVPRWRGSSGSQSIHALGSPRYRLDGFAELWKAETSIHCGPMMKVVADNLAKLLAGQTTEFCDWIRSQMPADLHPFDKASVDADLEVLTDSFSTA